MRFLHHNYLKFTAHALSKSRKMPTPVGLNDFSQTVTAPLNFHKQVQSRHMDTPTIQTAKIIKNTQKLQQQNHLDII